MTRVLQFKQTENAYVCVENGNSIFEISKIDLQFNVKNFYYAFYGTEQEDEEIILENTIPEDKKAKRVYDCIATLMERIKEKLSELSMEDEAERIDDNDAFLESE